MDLHFEVNGKGLPVVLIHGGRVDLRQWTFLASLLTKNYKVIVFDGRGAGKSPSPIKHANYVEDVLTLMDYLELNQATIISHSMGG
ncbi:alpha/beta hydrolase, partial [[Brevibacterium] frigoritolerans]|nr:alpha/beta hydrolase [Peribacillus frigoritolerans]